MATVPAARNELRGFILTLITILTFAIAAQLGAAARQQPARNDAGLVFDATAFTVKTANLGGQTVRYRAYEGLVYVARPVDPTFQRMNVFVPVEYFEGGRVGGFDSESAPIFLPNTVGGYMPGQPGSPGPGRDGTPNAALVALSKGYVVAAPGARGRTNQDASGKFVGKAPAVIVDLKAAVRYLRFNDARMPGNAERIVSNGTSAGGAVSALLGASGNNRDFEPYLKALGAADARDDIFATSAYCPITNLEHADMAYEWQFAGVNEFTRMMPRGPAPGGPGGPAGAGPAGAQPNGPPPGAMSPPPGPAGAGPQGPPPGAMSGGSSTGTMNEEQIRLSAMLKASFPEYVNGLGLKNAAGASLRLDSAGNGTFKDHVKSYVIASAQRALAAGKDLSNLAWLKVEGGKVLDLDFDQYVRFQTRMKVTPAFDGRDLASPENDLFGSADVKARHFTSFGMAHTAAPASLAEPLQVKMMNAMEYVGSPGTTTSRFWRIRHGAVDRDTSLAVPVLLATKLANTGSTVDFALPWGVPHSGDYDLDELFEWMGRITR